MTEVAARPRARAAVAPVANSAPADAAPAQSELAKVMAQIQEAHGANVMRRGDTLPHFLHLPTGIFTLDMALFGGVPESLVTQLHGWESSGKTTTAMRVVGAAQRKPKNRDKTAVVIDAEGTWHPEWARAHGVDPSRVIVVSPETGEQAVDIADAALRANDTSILLMDSLPALVPMKELDKSAEDATVALQARLIGTFIRKATQALLDERKRQHTPALLVINQWRNKIAMMGDTRNLPGGNALKFFLSVAVEVMNKEILGKDQYDVETVDYNEHSFKIKKNKLGTGIRTGEFVMLRNPSHPRGAGFIDDGKTVLTYAKRFGVFAGAGSSWRIDGIDIRFGKIQEAIDWLYDRPEEFVNLKNRLISMQRQHAGLAPESWL